MSNHFPSAIDLADDTLASKPHSTLHGNLGDTLSDFIDALGKVDLTGYQNLPTVFDPAASTWDENGYVSVQYGSNSIGLRIAPIHTGLNPDLVGFNLGGQATPVGTHQFSSHWLAYNDAGTGGVDISAQTSIDDAGTGRYGGFVITSDLDGYGEFTVEDGGPRLLLVANTAQTDPLLDLQDADANSRVIAFSGEGGNDASVRCLDTEGQKRAEISDDSSGVTVFDADGVIRGQVSEVTAVVTTSLSVQTNVAMPIATASLADYGLTIVNAAGDANVHALWGGTSSAAVGFFGASPVGQQPAGTSAADAIACLKAFGLMAT